MKIIDIVDDNPEDAERLKGFVEKYSEEKKVSVAAHVFGSGLEFLANYKSEADVVFLDVDMPILSGVEVAKKLREIDSGVCIIFITNMRQYVLKGYEVGALDYILKPVSYYGVVDRLQRAFALLSRKEKRYIMINISSCDTVRVAINEIRYIEKMSNYLIYHTEAGDYKVRGQLKDVEKDLDDSRFVRCINGCIVNLGQVEKTTQHSVFVGGTELPLARHRRQDFIDKLMAYYGGGARK